MISVGRYHTCPHCSTSLWGGEVPSDLVHSGFCEPKCRWCGGPPHWNKAIISCVTGPSGKIERLNWMCPTCAKTWSSE